MERNLHWAQVMARFFVAGMTKMIHNIIHNESFYVSLEAG
jgi:hypothetical protein